MQDDDVGAILFSREVIEERVKELAAQVVAVYREKPLTVAVVLRGAFVFAADLVRHLPQSCDIVFVRSASYGMSASPESKPVVELPAEVNWAGRNVLVIEDIVDTGHTLAELVATIRAKGAASVRVCAFLDKSARREAKVDLEFIGFEVEGDPFLVGYGLDFAGRFRNLPYVGTLKSPPQNG